MKHILLIILPLIFVVSSRAQQINIRTYSIEDGLVNNDVLSMYQDRHGFIWVCTRGGMSRYDGTRFTNYTTGNGLTNDMINGIVEIAPEKFIVAQNLEGPRLLENDRIGPLTQHSNLTLNNFYRVGNNRLLAATDQQGIVEWKKDNFHPLNADFKNGIDAMAMLNDSIWVTIRYNFSIQLVTNQLYPYSNSDIISASAIYTDSRQRTWLGTSTGLKLLDPRQQRNKSIAFLPLPSAVDLPVFRNISVSGFLEDSQGNFWIATAGRGIVRIHPNGKSTIYTETDGLPSSFINCISEDQQKNIWIGTAQGLAKFSIGNEIKIFKHNPDLSKGGSGYVLPLSSSIIRLFDTQSVTEVNLLTDSFTSGPLENSLNYHVYRVGKKELLLINKAGAILYKENETDAEIFDWPDISLAHIMRLDKENFVGAVGNKLFAIANGKVQGQLTLSPHIAIYFMLPDKSGNFWLATFGNGLYKIKWRQNKDSVLMELADSITHELPDQHIRNAFSDQENELWIGTRYKGVIRLLEQGKGKYEVQQYGTEQGLSSNYVRAINRDSKGNIWVGTPQGIDKLIPTGDRYRIFNFGKINNIYYFVQHISFLENDYLVTEGQVMVHARDLQQDTLPPPPVYITKASIGSVTQDGTIDGQTTRLSYRQPQIYFEFCAPQFISEEWNEYRYRLLGSQDTTWKKVAGSKSVNFASLKPGNYIFEVKVLGFNGQWGPAATYHFIVETPFWQKAWFISLIIAAVSLLLYALYRYRIQQLIRLQKVRNHIATDLHDEIGSNLTNISILSNLSKKNLLQPQQANEFLNRISEEVSSSSQALDDIIWSVNSKHDTLEETVSRMRRYAAELFDAADIHYDLYLDPAFDEKKLIMEQRRDIYLFYKEAVNNIFKHAEARHVIIKIAVENNQLILGIMDDGKGFVTKQEFHRHGLQGMKERVKKWNGKIEIESGDKGTSIFVRMPVAK